MTITTRQTSSEGVVNKGATLDNAELDANFIELAQLKATVVATTESATADLQSIHTSLDEVIRTNTGDQTDITGQSGTTLSVVVLDNRVVDTLPQDYRDSAVQFDIKQNATNGLDDGGAYNSTFTIKPWSDTTGGRVNQLGFTNLGSLHIRHEETANVWSSWRKLLTSSDLTPISTAISGKQDTLVSGTNLCTINGNSLLGNSDLVISSAGNLDGGRPAAIYGGVAPIDGGTV